MAMSYGGFIALGKEVTWGTEAARTMFARFLQAQFNDDPGWTISPHSQSRYDHTAHPGPYSSTLNATIEGRADILGEFLRSLFWVEPVTTNPGTLAYEHDFITPAATAIPLLKPYTAELRLGTANISEVGLGGFIDNMTFQWDERMLTCAFEMPCKSPEEQAPTGAPSFVSVAPFLFQNLTLVVDPDGTPAARNIRSGSLQISNNATKTRSSGSRFIEAPEAGSFQAVLQFSEKFNDLSDLKAMWSDDGTATSPQNDCDAFQQHVRLTFSGCEIEPGHEFELEFDLPAVIVSQVGTPVNGKDEIVKSLNLMALYDDATSKVVSARLKNTIVSY